MQIIGVFTFGLAWWLGLYLIARDPAKPLLRRAGFGLLAYALALSCDLLRAAAPTPALALLFGQLHWLLLVLPPILWAGALVRLLPEEQPLRPRLDRFWLGGLASLVGCSLLLFTGGLALVQVDGALLATPAYLLLALLALFMLLAGLVLVVRTRWVGRSQSALGLLGAATLLFTLSIALWVVPLGLMPRAWALPAIGMDLALLGLAVALLDAFDEGETLPLDIARSLAGALLAALLLGGQVVLVIVLGGGGSWVLLALLLGTVAAAIALATCSDLIQALVDRLVFASTPRLRQARAELREGASALPRLAETPPAALFEPQDFARLTRRALSHYGDLPRLASSPLTRLPVIEGRLLARGAPDQPLERAAELRQVLAESIMRLKPRGQVAFGTSDAWRHYNALYFPYVIGIKPYSRRNDLHTLDPVARQAAEWFASMVPERTLHNWQNAAARLVAADLQAQQPAQVAADLAVDGSG